MNASAEMFKLFEWCPFDTGVSEAAEQLRELRLREKQRTSVYSVPDRALALQELFVAAIEALSAHKPIEVPSVALAEAFLFDLPAWVPNPEVSLDHDGEVFLEWDNGRRCVFSASISPNAEISYAGLFGLSVCNGVEAFTGETPIEILRGIERATEHATSRD